MEDDHTLGQAKMTFDFFMREASTVKTHFFFKRDYWLYLEKYGSNIATINIRVCRGDTIRRRSGSVGRVVQLKMPTGVWRAFEIRCDTSRFVYGMHNVAASSAA